MRKKDAGLLHLRFAMTGFEIVPTSRIYVKICTNCGFS
jgi:hypothetical protein